MTANTWTTVLAMCLMLPNTLSCESQLIDPTEMHEGQIALSPTSSAPSANQTNKQSPPESPVEPIGAPEIRFIRPSLFGFRMDISASAAKPHVIALSPAPSGSEFESRIRHLLWKEIGRYPQGALGAVDSIVIGGTLTDDKLSVGGVTFLGMVFIATGERDAGKVTDEHVIRAFHHECSHALMNVHQAKFDVGTFRAALPTGFQYAEDRPGATKRNPLEPDEELLSLELLNDGFLIPWAKRNMEEDFASYAEVLFENPKWLLSMFHPESRVGRKARVVRDFYIAIDSRFESLFNAGE
jgi:hypothetical protein